MPLCFLFNFNGNQRRTVSGVLVDRRADSSSVVDGGADVVPLLLLVWESDVVVDLNDGDENILLSPFKRRDLTKCSELKTHHGVTDQVSQVAFPKSTLFSRPVQEDQSLSHNLSRVVCQVLFPLLHIGKKGWIWTRRSVGGKKVSDTWLSVSAKCLSDKPKPPAVNIQHSLNWDFLYRPRPADLHTLFTKHIQPRTRTLRRDRDVPVIVPQELLLSQINHACLSFDSLLIPEFSDSFSINPTALLSLEQSEADGRVELTVIVWNKWNQRMFVCAFIFIPGI